MEQIAKKITRWLVSKQAIEEAENDLYIYIFYSILATIGPLMVSVIIACWLGTFWELAIILISFLTVRKYSGGFHAGRYGVCFIGSCIILCIGMIVAAELKYEWWISAITSVSLISLFVLSPIDSENRKLDSEEEVKFKKITIVLSMIFYAAHWILLLLPNRSWSISIAIGLWMCAVLQLPCINRKLRRERGMQ